MRVLFMIAFFGCASIAAAESQSFLECKVKKVHSDEYENQNDFEFKEYPYLVVSPAKDGWKVIVGAMTYGEDPEQEELLQPEQIHSMWIAPTELKFYTEHEIENWYIEVNLSKQQADFWFYENDISAEPTRVATFSCDLTAVKKSKLAN